jgi:hypothetical protein
MSTIATTGMGWKKEEHTPPLPLLPWKYVPLMTRYVVLEIFNLRFIK